MATGIGCSSSPFRYFQLSTNAKLRVSQFVSQQSVAHLTVSDKDNSYGQILGVPKLRARLQKQQTALVVGSEDQPQIIFPISKLFFHISGNHGKPVVSFCNRPFSRDNEVISSNSEMSQRMNTLSWFFGSTVLYSSFIYPQLILPKVIPKIFGDSSLTVFLLLFFSDAIFYYGVAVFVHLLDHLMRLKQLDPSANNSNTLNLQLEQRISSDATLVVLRQLSIAIPMVTMGLTWPWIGPVLPATLVPYLVGVFVQFAFEQFARYWKSPSWAAIPFIFHAYRLHQIHRAANYLTLMSFTLEGAHLACSKLPVTRESLLTISNVLRFLIVICIWSFSSFLMRFLSSSASATMQ